MSEYFSDLSSSNDDLSSSIDLCPSPISSSNHRDAFFLDNNDHSDGLTQEERDINEAIQRSLADQNILAQIRPKPLFAHNSSDPNPHQKSPQQEREMTLEEIIAQSQNEERETNVIREFISNRELLKGALAELEGVNPDHECFEQFYA